MMSMAARKPQVDTENAVDRRLVDDGIRQLERSLEHFKQFINGGLKWGEGAGNEDAGFFFCE